MKKFSSLHKGFTLVELMIVIAIIGILAAVLYPALTGYLERTRDTNRQQAMNQMGTVLGTYYADRNEYPGITTNNCLDGLKSALVEGSVQYLKALPKDPKLATNKINSHCGDTGYGYRSFNGNANYIAGAQMEIVSNGNIGLDAKPTGITTGKTYNELVSVNTSTVEHIRDSIIEKSKMGDLAKGKKAVFAVYNQ